MGYGERELCCIGGGLGVWNKEINSSMVLGREAAKAVDSFLSVM